MKFDRRCKLHKATAKEDSKYALTSIWFDADHRPPAMVATDGRMLAVVPVEPELGDKSALIPGEAIKTACAKGVKFDGEGELACVELGEEIIVQKSTGASEHFDAEASDFPKCYADVVPPAGRDGAVSICLDPFALSDLAEAIGAHGVMLTFLPNGKSPIRVDPLFDCASQDAVGVLMPIKAAPDDEEAEEAEDTDLIPNREDDE